MAPATTSDTPLRRILKEQGRMQIWLAQRVDVHPSEISDYVRGVHVPVEATRQQIARALDVPESTLWPQAGSAAA